MGHEPPGRFVDEASPVVRAAVAVYDALNRDDRAAVIALLHKDVQIVAAGAKSAGVDDVQSGHAGMRRLWDQLDAKQLRARIIVREAREVGGRAVSLLAITNVTAEGSYDLASMVWAVVSIDDDGLVVSTWSYLSEEEALAAVRNGRPD
jgi:hypothetical protein